MVDPATYQVLVSSFGSIVEEMQSALFRTGFSTAIRESHDASSALLMPDGRLLGQMAILPTHMGAFPACAAGLVRRYSPQAMRPGDVFVMNDPYQGGSAHSADVAVITPAFHEGELVAFAATMAHKSDLGSITPGGGASQARDIFQEGLLIPPVRFGREIEEIIRRNSRTPEVVIGDLRGQIGANRVGTERVAGLAQRWGLATVREAAEELFARTEARVRRAVGAWPDGRYRAEGFLDNDGIGTEPVRLALELAIDGDRICFDFSGSDPQTRGPVNINTPLVRACCYYGLVASIDPGLPNNAGLHRVVEARFAPRSVLNPEFPAAVNVYVYTLTLAAELVLGALGQVAPDRLIACSGSTGGLTLAYEQDGRTRVQYELLGTGGGARRRRDGVNAIQTHVVNCRNAPIEIIETEFPVRVRRFELRSDSGGAGRFRGGLGYTREYEILAEWAALSVRGDRHRFAAWGVDGGGEGALGRFVINPGSTDERVIQARTSGVTLRRGDILLLQTPGGGGFGPPAERDPEAVRADVADGYVSREAAITTYTGITLTDTGG